MSAASDDPGDRREEREAAMRDAIERRIPPNRAVLDAMRADWREIDALRDQLRGELSRPRPNETVAEREERGAAMTEAYVQAFGARAEPALPGDCHENLELDALERELNGRLEWSVRTWDKVRALVRSARERDRLESDVKVAVRGHTPECSAMRDFLGTASEDPGCDCGFQEATARGVGQIVQSQLAALPALRADVERLRAERDEAQDERDRAIESARKLTVQLETEGREGKGGA
jgi:hypothetical protein